MKNQYSKSTFHKLYLIDKEMYDRILPYMNEVDKQELNDLNAEHRPEYEDAEEVVEEESPREKEEELETSNNVEQNYDSNEILNESPREGARESLSEASQPAIAPQKFPSTEDEKLQPSIKEDASGKETKVKRAKKYACNICVNKKFTTRSSLNRHHKTFHIVQPLNKAIETETKTKDITSNATSKPSTAVKRQREDDEFSIDSNEKSTHYGNLEYENTLERRGLKRKGPKRATDLEPRKKFHWESFDSNETKHNADISTPNRGLKRKSYVKRATDLAPRKKFRWETY